MKVALVHDWLTGMRGGEKCLAAFCRLFPDADLYTLVHKRGSVAPLIEDRRIVTSWLQRCPGVSRYYRYLLPLMPMAVEGLNLDGYDLVLSSSHCVAKSVLTPPEALHISYVHTPMRYAWDQWPHYFPTRGLRARLLYGPVLGYLRSWDAASATRVDRYVANSHFVAERIRKYYRREATVVHPPVDADYFDVEGHDGGYYLVVSALVPYKGVDLAVEAANRLEVPLKVVGEGPLWKRLRALAGETVELTGWLDDEALRDCYAGCRALILPAVEDFGIVPLEAAAAGRPSIVLGRGGSLDTVVPLNDPAGPGLDRPPTGVYFEERSVDALVAAMRFFEAHEAAFDRDALRRHARRFDRPVFEARMRALIDETLERRTRRSETIAAPC